MICYQCWGCYSENLMSHKIFDLVFKFENKVDDAKKTL